MPKNENQIAYRKQINNAHFTHTYAFTLYNSLSSYVVADTPDTAAARRVLPVGLHSRRHTTCLRHPDTMAVRSDTAFVVARRSDMATIVVDMVTVGRIGSASACHSLGLDRAMKRPVDTTAVLAC